MDIQRMFMQTAVSAAGEDREQLEAVLRSIDELPHLADVVGTAPSSWATAPMVETAIDAWLTVPEVHLDREAPSPSGLMAFATPLPPLPSGGPVPVSAIMWRGDGKKIAIITISWREHLPVGEAALSDFADKLEHSITVRVLRDRIPGLENCFDEEDGRSLLSVLSSDWMMMVTPTVADRMWLDTTHHGGRQHQDETPAQPVTLIDLRPLRHTDFSETNERGHACTHRFVVRGHWRNQAHGPNVTQDRLTWIPSYINGPEGAPLEASDKVVAWHR